MKIDQEVGPAAATMRAVLLQLARHEDTVACDEAAAVRYWEPLPPSVLGHRSAAAVLRSYAESLLGAQAS